ncbi:MAG: DUF1203 domain-containing protein [Betaproteobacteria bacterium]|nr:MAG: DUF1203 domain-containing protein [Betaproteobacteria bacterium]
MPARSGWNTGRARPTLVLMTRFRCCGIAAAVATEVRRPLRAPAYRHPVRTFAIGKEERILFTYQPFREAGSLPAPGPVFIHAEQCERYDAPELPAGFRSLPLVLEAYAPGSALLAQERLGERSPDEVLAALFERNGADYVHIRNGEVGCFMARVERQAVQHQRTGIVLR